MEFYADDISDFINVPFKCELDKYAGTVKTELANGFFPKNSSLFALILLL